MKPSNSEQEQRFHAALRTCYDLADVSQVPYRCLAAVKELIPGSIHGWDQFSLSTGQHENFADYHPDLAPVLPDAVEGITNRVMDHPVARLMLADGPPPRVSQMTDFLTRRQIRDTGIYQEGYRLLRVADNMVLHFQDGDTTVALSCHHDGGERYTAAQEHYAGLLVPHLKQALRNARIHSAAKQQHEGAILPLDSTARVQDWPAPIVQAIARIGIPHCPPPGLQNWIKKQVEHLKHQGPITPISLPFARRGRGLAVEFYFMPPRFGFCLFCRITENAYTPKEKLPLLSKREMEVLSWMAAGKRDAEIAQILGIARRTAEQHAGSVLKKLEVETRTAAAQAFLASKGQGTNGH